MTLSEWILKDEVTHHAARMNKENAAKSSLRKEDQICLRKRERSRLQWVDVETKEMSGISWMS